MYLFNVPHQAHWTLEEMPRAIGTAFARRLLRLAVDGQHEGFYKELGNGGCDGWDPEAQPDWILIQGRFSM